MNFLSLQSSITSKVTDYSQHFNLKFNSRLKLHIISLKRWVTDQGFLYGNKLRRSKVKVKVKVKCKGQPQYAMPVMLSLHDP